MSFSKKILSFTAGMLFLGIMANCAQAEEQFSKAPYQSIFYVNDIHGQLPTMIKITNASAQFDAVVSKLDNVDSLKLSSGDIFIGSDDNANKTSSMFLNVNEITETVLGNHEFDMGATKLSKILPYVKAVKVGANATYPANNPIKNQVVKSVVVTGKSGEKYGIVGAQSPTLIERMKDPSLFEGITISGGQKAYKEIQSEVNKLTKQGIKRIIVLSHSGYEEEKELAKHVSDIDVILGGHSHDLIFDITEGKNLQYSPKGEPVIITQAGRDGKKFGILNVEYDKNGIVVKAQNNVFTTADFNKNHLMLTTADILLGQSPVLGSVKFVEPLTDRMNVEENPYSEKFMDIVRSETKADVVLMNSANFRGSLDLGNFTARDIGGIFPFKNKMCIVELSEKNLIEALNRGGSSLTAPDLKPSILQVSGMTYTLSKDGKTTKATVFCQNGNKVELNVKNPSDKKMFTVAYDDYLLAGGDAFVSLKDAKVLKKYDYDKDQIVINYFLKNKDTAPLELRRDGRVKFE